MIHYALSELESVIKSHRIDVYHKELMQWAVDEIKRLKKELNYLTVTRTTSDPGEEERK